MTKKQQTCPGWIAGGFPLPGCGKPAGTPWTDIWCPECDKRRREHITRQLEDMLKAFSAVRPAAPRGMGGGGQR